MGWSFLGTEVSVRPGLRMGMYLAFGLALRKVPVKMSWEMRVGRSSGKVS